MHFVQAVSISVSCVSSGELVLCVYVCDGVCVCDRTCLGTRDRKM